jgi:iron complex transport system substrate-binding protein
MTAGIGRAAAAIAVAVLVAAGCGDDAGGGAGGSDRGAGASEMSPVESSAALAGLEVVDDGDPALPVTVVDSTGTEVTVASTDRIVAANGDLTEVTFALGLGDQVVARDVSATYPAEATSLPSIGYQRALTAETTAAYEPTVVLANTLAGPAAAIDQMRDIGLPVVVLDYEDTVDGPGDKIRAVGAALGVPDRAEDLAARVDDEVAAAQALAGEATSEPRVAALYLRGEGTQLLFGPGSGMSVMLGASGVVDVGAELGVDDAAPVDIEALLAAAPDVLIVTDTGLESVGGVEGLLAMHDGALARTPAGEQRRILAYDDQYLLGFGPRAGAALAELIHDLHPELEDIP